MKLLAWVTTYKKSPLDGAILGFSVAGCCFVGGVLGFFLGEGFEWRGIGIGCMFFAIGISLLHKSRQDEISEHGPEDAREADEPGD